MNMKNNFMGPEEYRKFIREMPEDSLKEEIIEDMKRYKKSFIEGSFDSLIDLLISTGLHLNCINRTTPDEARKFLVKLLNCFNIKDRNVDETLDYIIASSTFHPQRISDWHFSKIDVITDNQEKVNLKCYSAEFKQVDNWKREIGPDPYEIICHENQVLWHTFAPDDFLKPKFFIMKKNKICGLSIHHTYNEYFQSIMIFIWDNLYAIHNDICVTLDTLDEIKNKHENNKEFDKTQMVELDDDSYKEFFNEMMQFDRNKRRSGFKTQITGFVGGYLKIEITNPAYSSVGYILLDIENNKVIEAKIGGKT
jgi:hypothetical protein